jgi:hypothetical protein
MLSNDVIFVRMNELKMAVAQGVSEALAVYKQVGMESVLQTVHEAFSWHERS